MPTNGAPVQDDLERTVKLILAKARRLRSVDTVAFSLAHTRLCSTEQIRWIEEQVAERARGLRIAWVRHQ